MKIGVHPFNLHLRIASVWPKAFADFDPGFVHYGEGRDTLCLLVEGRIDVGGTGSTPAVLAAASGHPVIYLAGSVPRPANGGIFLRADSKVSRVAELAGKRVALIKGSFHTYLLARALEAEGLSLSDLHTVEPPNAQLIDLLLSGEIDAWIAMSPQIERTERRADLRLLVRCGTMIPNRSLFWTLAGRQLDESTRAAFATELAHLGAEIDANPQEAAARLVKGGAKEATVEEWTTVIRGRSFAIEAANAQILTEQAEEEAVLRRHRYLPLRQTEAAQ